jgi:hypothetical protein
MTADPAEITTEFDEEIHLPKDHSEADLHDGLVAS